MRKITLIIFICLVSFFAKAQFTTPNYQFSSKTKLMQVLGGLRPDSGFIVSPRFPDTATANLSVVHLYGGMLIRVLDTMWLRNESATQWNKVGSSSGGSTPSLQQVTDVGNTTTDGIYLNGTYSNLLTDQYQSFNATVYTIQGYNSGFTTRNSYFNINNNGAWAKTGNITANSLLHARGNFFTDTLQAHANNDTLTGEEIRPVFTDNGFTGVTHFGLISRGDEYINGQEIISGLSGNSNRLVWNDNTGLLYNTSWQIVSDSLNPYITNLQNGCLSGCIVTWDTLYTYIISPSTYRIGGVYYSSPADTITLAAADPTDDRIDAFVVNTSGLNDVVQGTPANPALSPDIDISTQLQISFAVVSAGTTSPTIDTATIYKENLGTPTEWTYSDNTATITPSSINFPYQGLVDIEGTTVAASVNFTLTAASSPTFTNYTQLNFKIRSKGAWSTGRGFAIQFLNGSTPIGNPVPFLSGSYNFISATTGVYQNVSIPLADFGNITNATSVRFLRAGTSTIPGFYIDNIILIGGAASGGGTGIQTITASAPITATQTGTAVNISTSMATNKLIGRSTAGTGVMEQITVGSGLSLSGGTLSATGSGGSVTSVGLTSSDITVGGATSPITTSGTYTLTLATVNSNVGTFGDATHVGQFTVNGKGLVTAASNVSITGFASSTLTNTHIFVGNGSNVATDVAASGDLTLANTGAFTFNTVNSNVGSFTNASITVNAKGLITAASSGTAPVTTFSAGTTGFTPNSATSGAVTLAGTLVLANGGTSASLTASNGGIFYSTSSAGAILSGTATANKMLLSGATAAPTWSTSTIPSSAGATANKVLLSDGTNYVLSTPTFPNASATSGKIIISDGTNWIASTPTYPSAAGSSGNVLTSDGTNWTSAAPTSSGTVTTFSAGTLSPLFTTSVANASTTPALSFSLSNASGGTVFGNNTTSAAAPAYTAVPVLGIAGTTLGTLGLSGNTSGVVTISPAAAAGTWTFTLPTTGGTSNYVLTTNGSGTSTWTNPATLPAGTAAGSNTEIQYNNSGAFGSSSNFRYASPKLTLYNNGLGTTLVAGNVGLSVEDTTTSTVGTPSNYGPIIQSLGTAYKSNSTASSYNGVAGFRSKNTTGGANTTVAMEFLIGGGAASSTSPTATLGTWDQSTFAIGSVSTVFNSGVTISAHKWQDNAASSFFSSDNTNVLIGNGLNQNINVYASTTTNDVHIWGGRNQNGGTDQGVSFFVGRPSGTFGIGSVTNAAGGTTVTGANTRFTEFFKVGDAITIAGTETQTITVITDNTHMTTNAWTNLHNATFYQAPAAVLPGLSVMANGQVGIETITPTAHLHIAAGAAAINQAPLKLTTGTNLTIAEAGAIEYTTPQLFFTNGGGQRQEIPQIQQSRVSSDFSKTSDASLANVTGLTATLVAGKTYRFEAALYTTSANTGGIQFAIAGTCTATNIIYDSYVMETGLAKTIGTSRATTLATKVSDVTSVTAGYVKITGTITVNAAGTLTLQFAQNVSDGTASKVLQGSTFITTEMN